MATAHSSFPTAKPRLRAIGADVVVNVALPFVVYGWAAPAMGEAHALMLSSVPPILSSLLAFARRRSIDAISLLAIAGIVLSLLAFYGGGGVRMLQLREKLVTGIVGLGFVISAAIGRPALYEIAKAGMKRTGSDHSNFVRAYGPALFRRRLALMTIVWGLALIADVAVSAVLVFVIPIPAYLIVNPLLGYAVMGALTGWSLLYARRHGLNGPRAKALMPKIQMEA
ncbi:hypothetical protein FHS31_000722 [Sphingomonas vulcanisoli]|uniref:DUF3159 domain-containing protein n=1 Tax=Sphingomonas vulcanisoli TaxID=1658060 RepID=A0ABX0TSF4_9SPHN|nr:VC0807 family protein [Sphingomonas vulcanisoli]NIJ07140.1 hypothetical protein [Sphingomonas vulcanisoli]